MKRRNNNKKTYSAIGIRNRNIKEIIEKRYTILIIVIIVVLLFLAIRLFTLQIIKHSYYTGRVEQLTQNTVSSNSTPRGRIYDRNGKVIVDNEAVKVIFYKKQSNITIKEEIDMAYKVAEILSLESKTKESELRTFWVKQNPKEARNKITEEEWKQVEERKLTNDDIEKLKLERVTEEELATFNDLDKEAAKIYSLMNTGYSYAEKIIKKENVTDEEYALIAENTETLKGFDVRLDWQRVYPYGDTFRTLLGSVSSTESGIPYELKDHYLNLGYSLNDRVGTSYLEYQYEEVLRGTKTVYQILEDGSRKVIKEGQRGNDIVLSIDIELQQQIEQIVKEEILKAKQEPNTKYYNRSFVVISDPNTGEILAMAGKQIQEVNGEYKIYDYSPGLVTTPVTVGSVVKGASHITGYNTGALKIGERRTDECIKIASTPRKCSWTSLGVMDDISALKFSSNVFQFKTAINVGKGNYVYDKPLSIDTEAFNIYRNTFGEFGLGVLTGIDLPIESTGYKGTSQLPGHLLDFAIGQYDNYTPLQLSQYINTIANGGYRMKPTLLKAVYEPTKEPLTNLIYENPSEVLNKVNTEQQYMDRIRQGFREVMTGGTGAGYLVNALNPAGKTGTAESFVDTDGDGRVDAETITATFAGYAPYDNPKVSFVIVSPDIFYKEGTSSARTGVNRRISTRISQKYFDLYK